MHFCLVILKISSPEKLNAWWKNCIIFFYDLKLLIRIKVLFYYYLFEIKSTENCKFTESKYRLTFTPGKSKSMSLQARVYIFISYSEKKMFHANCTTCTNPLEKVHCLFSFFLVYFLLKRCV